ncbi:hypothetical protein BDW42DRAFT_84556 [Aspergillus taichungensis]|uniref:Uncharacterized protein n=1 Tax=Aspergillus taichungensis TaxID=482145 RepID=A0A2J5HXT1_9EURO|nr:hypothetical protein BDW42DRAFT_84556 [Aspergillus taichungensis]
MICTTGVLFVTGEDRFALRFALVLILAWFLVLVHFFLGISYLYHIFFFIFVEFLASKRPLNLYNNSLVSTDLSGRLPESRERCLLPPSLLCFLSLLFSFSSFLTPMLIPLILLCDVWVKSFSL